MVRPQCSLALVAALVKPWFEPDWCEYEGILGGPYLNVGHAQARDGADSRTRDSWRFEGQHGLEAGLQVCYSRRHGDQFVCIVNDAPQSTNYSLVMMSS